MNWRATQWCNAIKEVKILIKYAADGRILPALINANKCECTNDCRAFQLISSYLLYKV